jgi:hypothetical protein
MWVVSKSAVHWLPSRIFPGSLCLGCKIVKHLRTGTLAALLTATVFASTAGAAVVGIYRNPMDSKAQLGEIFKLSGRDCGRAGTGHALRVIVGKRTQECSYRTTVFGRDLEIAASARLLSSTPKALQKSTFVALNLRAGGGARYQLAVYPLQRKAQLRKVLSDGTVEYLDIEKNLAGVGGLDKANDLRLRAFNITKGAEKGDCHLLAFVGGEQVSDVSDEGAGELTGEASGFSVGSAKAAKGAEASFDDVVVRVPGPF